MKLDQYKHIYFIGIGGIGMSAIARYFLSRGKEVSGYDRTHTKLTRTLEDEGMHIHYEDKVALIPHGVDLVVFTPAIPKDHQELNWFKSQNIPMMKRAEALGIISKDKNSVCIAGTHGKTTTSSLVTHVLKNGGIDISAFLGGVTLDYDSNFLIGESDIVVLEADEYDRSFLWLNPQIAAITSMDPDHLDIYGDGASMISGFKAFASNIKDDGILIIRYGLLEHFSQSEQDALTSRNVKIYQYGADIAGDIRIYNFSVVDGKYLFDYEGLGHKIKNIEMSMPGRHNAENACVAISVGILEGVAEDKIKQALRGFRGIHRRFEKIIDRPDLVYIDDYAHHPSELNAAIDAVRKLYVGKKITGVFQPHLYSRTRDFADGFAQALDKLDEIILMDIYPAREEPMVGVNAEMIFERMKNPNKKLASKSNLMDVLKDCQVEVLITLGAGDIDTFVQKIKVYYENR